LDAELSLTFGSIKELLRPAGVTVFDSTQSADWTAQQQKDYAKSARDARVGSKESRALGLDTRPPFSFLENLIQALPPGVDAVNTSSRLGERLARVSRYRLDHTSTTGDPAEETIFERQIGYWSDFSAAVVLGAEIPASRLDPVLDVIRTHFRARFVALSASFPRIGLGELVPLVGQQCYDLEELLSRQRRRVLSLLKLAGTARASVWNTEWEEFLTPFFRDVLATGAAVTSPARLTASLARAAEKLP
jgi:hypothetical protein